MDITKSQFESFVPAARHKDGSILAAVQTEIEAQLARLKDAVVGTYVYNLIDTTTPPEGYEELAEQTLRTASLAAFAEQMPQLDVVLTATGFGVVSTSDTAPASKERVSALLAQIRHDALIAEGDLLRMCFQTDQWAATQLEWMRDLTVFYHPRMLERYAGTERVTPELWQKALPLIADDIDFLRERISDELMDDLVRTMATSTETPSDEYRHLVQLIRRHVGDVLLGQDPIKSRQYRNIINYIEGNLAAFSLYEGSDAYFTNHPPLYDNSQNPTAFHFVG